MGEGRLRMMDPAGPPRALIAPQGLRRVELPGAGVECGSAVAEAPAGRRNVFARPAAELVLVWMSRGFDWSGRDGSGGHCPPNRLLLAPPGAGLQADPGPNGRLRMVWIEAALLSAVDCPAALSGPASVSANSAAARLLMSYAEALAAHPVQEPALAMLAARQLAQLAAPLVLGALAATPARQPAGAWAADRDRRRQALLGALGRACHQPGLTLTDFAAAQGLGPRNVQRLLGSGGDSFSGALARLRLELARDRLSDPDRAGERIADIAFEAGFSDLASFNRRFRRHYGCTPGALRRGAA